MAIEGVPEMKLAADEYRKHKRYARSRAKRGKVAAKAALAEKEFAEGALLLNAAERGLKHTSYDLKTALNVAAAARDTVRAEELYVLSKKRECELALSDIHDSLEDVRARLLEAEDQFEYF